MVFYFFPHGKHWDHVRTSFNHHKQPFLKLPLPPKQKNCYLAHPSLFYKDVGETKNPATGRGFLSSERRGSNSRHPPWQGGALPAELLSQFWGKKLRSYDNPINCILAGIQTFFPVGSKQRNS